MFLLKVSQPNYTALDGGEYNFWLLQYASFYGKILTVQMAGVLC